MLLFLSEVEEGGETVFPSQSEWAYGARPAAAANFSACARRGPAVKPRTGDAILFWSMSTEGVEDHSAMHASCPVLAGEKWTATKWLHTTRFQLGEAGEKNSCSDKAEDVCAGWARGGECKGNSGYMVGSGGYGGACVRACCLPARREGATEADCKVCEGEA